MDLTRPGRSGMLHKAQAGGTEMEEGAAIFTNIFWLTIAFLFLSTIIGTVIMRRQRDRCLKLLHDFHVTLQMADGRAVWGDLQVFAQGLEVRFDEPYHGKKGPAKATFLLYESELNRLVAIARYVGELTPEEREERQKQVLRRSNPGFLRRFRRSVRNLINTIRDTFTQVLSLVLGQVNKAGKSAFLKSRSGDVEKLGQTILGEAGNAWEPMLERYIGRPVVVELITPDKSVLELAGYLAEYSERFIALFNIEHSSTESTLELVWVKTVDVVAPRAIATVRHAGIDQGQ